MKNTSLNYFEDYYNEEAPIDKTISNNTMIENSTILCLNHGNNTDTVENYNISTIGYMLDKQHAIDILAESCDKPSMNSMISGLGVNINPQIGSINSSKKPIINALETSPRKQQSMNLLEITTTKSQKQQEKDKKKIKDKEKSDLSKENGKKDSKIKKKLLKIKNTLKLIFRHNSVRPLMPINRDRKSIKRNSNIKKGSMQFKVFNIRNITRNNQKPETLKHILPKVEISSEKRIKSIQTAKNLLKIIDTIAAICALISSVITYYENEEFLKNGNISSSKNTSMRISNIPVTFIICFCILLHYIFKLEYLKLKKLKLPDDNLKTSGLLWKMIFELLYCMIFCPPELDYSFTGYMMGYRYQYSYNSIINILTMGKSYLILRLYGHYSEWMTDQAKQICKTNKCEANLSFAIKSELKKRPIITLIILISISIFYMGFAIRICEITYEFNEKNSSHFDFKFLTNSFWLIIITMTTVGFGEGYPSTHPGRFIGFMACLIGMVLVSLWVITLTNLTEISNKGKNSVFILQKINANQKAKADAANVLKSIFAMNKSMKKEKNVDMIIQRFIVVMLFKRRVFLFKTSFGLIKPHNLSNEDMMWLLDEKINKDFEEIKKEARVLEKIYSMGNEIVKTRISLKQKFDEIKKYQQDIDSLIEQITSSINHQK